MPRNLFRTESIQFIINYKTIDCLFRTEDCLLEDCSSRCSRKHHLIRYSCLLLQHLYLFIIYGFICIDAFAPLRVFFSLNLVLSLFFIIPWMISDYFLRFYSIFATLNNKNKGFFARCFILIQPLF